METRKKPPEKECSRQGRTAFIDNSPNEVSDRYPSHQNRAFEEGEGGKAEGEEELTPGGKALKLEYTQVGKVFQVPFVNLS